MIRSLPSPVPASRWTSWITPLCVLGCRSTPPLPVACRKAALTSPKSTASVCLTGTDGPVACFVYDKMKDVQFHWEDTLQRKILHPRIEEALKKFPRSADSIRRKLFGVMEEMLNALKNRFEKEAEQLEFFQQLRVLNPRNLSDMDTNLSSYKSLKLDEVPGVQEEWNLYRRTEFRNINNGDELLAWWESRPDSLFKEAVLFLITIPTSSGAVERFFSQASH